MGKRSERLRKWAERVGERFRKKYINRCYFGRCQEYYKLKALQIQYKWAKVVGCPRCQSELVLMDEEDEEFVNEKGRGYWTGFTHGILMMMLMVVLFI